MDKFTLKLSCLFASACLFISFTYAQEARSLPVSSRRRLPTVIITREHLRQRQNSYGTPGDTAAEFVVSAGLDTSKNSAVRIRRIGHRRVNGSHIARPGGFENANGTRRVVHTNVRINPQFRTPYYNIEEQNGIPNTRTSINRRYHLNEGNRNIIPINRRNFLNENEQRVRPHSGGFYQNDNRNPVIPERTFYPYRPPIFVPNYQHNRRSDGIAGGVPGEGKRRLPNREHTIPGEGENIYRYTGNDQIYPIVNVKYSTSSVTSSVSNKQHTLRPVSNPTRNGDVNMKAEPVIKNNQRRENHWEAVKRNNQNSQASQNNSQYRPKDRLSTSLNNKESSKISSASPLPAASKQHSLNPESTKVNVLNENKNINESSALGTIYNRENVHKKHKGDETNKENSNNSNNKLLNETEVPRNIVAEYPDKNKTFLSDAPSDSNLNKIRQFQTHLIRKPSLVLRDQITVNELPKKLGRPRYGPRALEHTDDNTSSSRRKREAHFSDGESLNAEPLSKQDAKNNSDNAKDTPVSANVTEDDLPSSNASQRHGRYDIQAFGPQISRWRTKSPTPLSSRVPKIQTNEKESRVAPVYEMFSDGTYDTRSDTSEKDVMSFSDFIASPMAQQIRLERQMFFRNLNHSKENRSTEKSFHDNAKIDSRSLKNSTIEYLKNVLTARLIQNILALSNVSTNGTKLEKTVRSSEGLSSAEQRHIGIMVTPYEDQEIEESKPVIRVLKGRIVSLPDLPQELIPIIMGTYKPTYTEEQEMEEPKFDNDGKISDDILDNAIYKLLQSEDLLNFQPVARKPPRPVAYKMSRKSPSTNYVGSMKTNEPMGQPKFIYKPNEWSLDPRCDRLTEEICLDDSDYPSSAIMTSIYKDKAKFDMMYAEVKVHESQVEGLSRQQETAFSLENFYGAYPQASGSNMVSRDAGPQHGFVCPSEVYYARPHRAKNRQGEWKVVVNVGEYTQTLRMEKCLSSGSPCKYVVNRMQSTCAQVFNYHRLLVFSKERGLHIDVFRVPIACTCYLRGGQKNYNPTIAASSPYMVRPVNPYEEYGGHVETAPVPQVHGEGPVNKEKKKNSFSNTLWAILGGGQQASALAQHPQFLDEVQKQITWTQQLNKYPQLMKQISPNQVLKQLLEEDEEDYSIRRQRIRQKQQQHHPFDHLTSNGFASHHFPYAVPLPPPPPPPPSAIPRRPVVGMSPADQKQIFAISPDSQTKIIAVTSPSEPTKVFSLTKDPHAAKGSSPMRYSHGDSGHRSIYAIVRNKDHPYNNNNNNNNRMSGGGYKVQPGMYPPSSENVQIPESSLIPVAPQFSSHPDNPMKPVMKPLPAPRGSNKSIVEDEDLVAAEKTVGEGMHAYAVETVTDSRDAPQDDNESKINFSYHPILEYLNV